MKIGVKKRFFIVKYCFTADRKNLVENGKEKISKERGDNYSNILEDRSRSPLSKTKEKQRQWERHRKAPYSCLE